MPATRKCCIVGCRSSSRYNPNLQFFQFPRPDNPYHQQWIEACQASMSHILPFKKPVLCSLHFLSHYIGGRRLTSNAIPTLKLDVPSNLKLAETQSMLDEIERSRKFAYINAVVYEWLVRANMNPQLRGSITHGMIKEKAETAKKIIGCESFMADNRWLNRFRESHLTNFAKKLSTNQLKPMGPSLWIPDIVHDLQHSFPPANVERIENLVNVPEQYLSYMKQYGDYEEEDGNDPDQTIGGGQEEQDDSFTDSKTAAQNYFKNYQAGRNFYEQVQHQYDQNDYAEGDYNTYEDYYQDREQQDKLNNSYNNKSNSRPSSHTSAQQRSSPYTPTHNSSKRRLSNDDTDGRATPKVKRIASDGKDSRSQSPSSTTEINENSNKNKNNSVSDTSFKIRLPLLTNGQNTNNNNTNTRSSNSPASVSSQPSRSNSPKSEKEPSIANGRISPTLSTATNTKELESYAQAIEYLKPLEDFALFAENFRAIGLLAQLEVVLKKGKRAAAAAEK